MVGNIYKGREYEFTVNDSGNILTRYHAILDNGEYGMTTWRMAHKLLVGVICEADDDWSLQKKLDRDVKLAHYKEKKRMSDLLNSKSKEV